MSPSVRILTWNHLSFTHNHNGERITKTDTSTSDTTTYAYDEMGLLTSVTLPNSDVIEYIYDGLGRRVGRIKNSNQTDQYVYSDQLQIIADLDPTTGEVRTRYVYASQSHSPDFMIRAGTTYRILKDRLGSVRLVVRTSDGVIAQEIEYDEFGRVLQNTNPGFQPFGFAGGLTDLETGLVRFGARDYDPITGRWTTKDPIGFNGGDPNLYGYVLQDPVNWIDPSGMFRNPWGIKKEAQERTEEMPGQQGGVGDAMRHCFASCEMARENGQLAARIAGDAVEILGGNSKNYRDMDYISNECGRHNAKKSKSADECFSSCMKSLMSGELRTLR